LIVAGRGALLGGVVALLAAAVGCAGSPESAGNATVEFMAAVQSQEYDRAYERLCLSQREATTPEQFAERNGAEFGELARLSSAAIEGESIPDEKTIDDDVTSTWTEWAGLSKSGLETWRVSLLREEGKWRVCEVDLQSVTQPDPDRYGP
jgi:hypothetical protein